MHKVIKQTNQLMRTFGTLLGFLEDRNKAKPIRINSGSIHPIIKVIGCIDPDSSNTDERNGFNKISAVIHPSD